MNLQLTGKTAIVTGGSAGIGLAITKALAAEGVTVTVPGRNLEKIQQALNGIPNTKALVADAATAEGADAIIAPAPATDILVNNLGIYEPKEFADITDADWFKLFETNVMSGVRLSRHYFPKMIAQNSGRIIFIASESAIMTPPEMVHYGMTKSAQLAISRGLAERTKGTAVTVNTVLPGPTRSEGIVGFLESISSIPNPTPEQAEKSSSKSTAAARSSSASSKPKRSLTWSPSSPARSPLPRTAPPSAPKAACCAASLKPRPISARVRPSIPGARCHAAR